MTLTLSNHKPQLNRNVQLPVHKTLCFVWFINGFNSSHFISSIQTQYPLLNMLKKRLELFTYFTDCKHILPVINKWYNHIRSNRNSSILAGYLSHSHKFPATWPTIYCHYKSSICSQYLWCLWTQITISPHQMLAHRNDEGWLGYKPSWSELPSFCKSCCFI